MQAAYPHAASARTFETRSTGWRQPDHREGMIQVLPLIADISN